MVVNDKDEIRILVFTGYVVVESPMLKPRARIFLGSNATPVGSAHDGLKSAQRIVKVLAVVDTGTVTEAVIVVR